jgi:hypothetical protein
METRVEFELMLGAMDEVGCESPNHGELPHGTGPATHYAMFMHECGDTPEGTLYAVCFDFAVYLSALSGSGICMGCNTAFSSVDEFVKIVGPVGN